MRVTILAASISALGVSAHAATLDPLAIIQSYNAIALDDFTMSASHVEGTMYVGGDLMNNSATDVNTDNQVPTVIGGALVVGGDVNSAEIRPPGTNGPTNFRGTLPTITAVPLPAAGWGLLAALGSLMAMRRRAA